MFDSREIVYWDVETLGGQGILALNSNWEKKCSIINLNLRCGRSGTILPFLHSNSTERRRHCVETKEEEGEMKIEGASLKKKKEKYKRGHKKKEKKKNKIRNATSL